MRKRHGDREAEAIFSMRIPKRLLDTLRNAAEEEDRSIGSLVRRILEAHVAGREKRRGR